MTTKVYESCDDACDPYRHTPTCKMVHGDAAVKAEAALDALDALLAGLKAADPDGPVSFYLPAEAVGLFSRAHQVLKDNGRRT